LSPDLWIPGDKNQDQLTVPAYKLLSGGSDFWKLRTWKFKEWQYHNLIPLSVSLCYTVEVNYYTGALQYILVSLFKVD